MATLPDVPQNTIVAIGILAGTGLVALHTLTRAKLDSQIHENYRQAKVVDANAHGGADIKDLHRTA